MACTYSECDTCSRQKHGGAHRAGDLEEGRRVATSNEQFLYRKHQQHQRKRLFHAKLCPTNQASSLLSAQVDSRSRYQPVLGKKAEWLLFRGSQPAVLLCGQISINLAPPAEPIFIVPSTHLQEHTRSLLWPAKDGWLARANCISTELAI